MKALRIICAFVLLMGVAGPAVGDWGPGDPHKMHYPQLPDLDDTGMDVLAGPLSIDPDPQPEDVHENVLADDFLCTESGPITNIHIWGSYNKDIRLTNIPWFSLIIYDNIPAGTGGIPWSRPGEPLWDAYLQPTAERIYAHVDVNELFFDPPDNIWGEDANVWQFNFEIDADSAFVQERDTIYWLGVHHSFDLNNDGVINLLDLFVLKMNWPGCFGWKTSGEQQYEDDAVFTPVMTFFDDPHVVPPDTAAWVPLVYPSDHPYHGQSLDLAFVITGPEPVELDFGDAPRPYPTMLTVDGARQVIGGPYFCDAAGGDSPDPEGDGQPHLNALGDDNNDGNDDEDGVQIPVYTAGVPSNMTVYVCGGGGVVEIWIDWHSDGSWDAGDMVFSGLLPDGMHLLLVWPPWDAVNGPTFARCRISTTGSPGPTGQADDGEVEDHEVYIEGGMKRPTPHLKWSQPPIPMDPLDEFPTFCGWDEPSWRQWVEPTWLDCWNCRTQCYGDADCDGDVDPNDLVILNAAFGTMWPDPDYDDCADFNRDLVVNITDLDIYRDNEGTTPPADCGLRPEETTMVADDFRCLGTMPIESIHWYGSYINWPDPEQPPPEQPIAWRIGFWSNDASHQRCDFLYGATNVGDLYKIDPSTGVATLIGPIGFGGVTGLSFAPDGTLYGSCRDAATGLPILITIDTMTGAGTAVGAIDPAGMQWAVPDISFRANGVLYGYGHNPDQLLTINTATGQGTVVGPTGYSGQGNGMDFAPNGTLYATPSDNQSLVIINPGTGAGSDVAGTVGNVPLRINALEFCQQHNVLFGSWNDSWFSGNWYLVTLDLNTGLPLTVVQTVPRLDAITFNEFSQPKELLKVIEVDASRVQIEPIGWDYYYDFYPSDSCWQYFVKLEPHEVFWQNKYLPRTEDKIFWLSITALYQDSDVQPPTYPWGWKTRPWHWMDDAVTFELYEEPAPGSVVDPNEVQPIKDPRYDESFDVTFELDTDPNYIKWEQPFTSILHWPHFWDEYSMSWLDKWIEYKWWQGPDPCGWDVAFQDFDGQLLELADDWRCDETGTIDDIHFWVSWESDMVGWIPWVTVRIYTNDPCGPGGHSEPNELKWERHFGPHEFRMTWYDAGEQGWFEPVSGSWDWPNHVEYFRIDINDINDPFIQEQGNIYWLSVEANSVDGYVGWKTSSQQWNDDAVYRDPFTGEWQELYDPMQPVPISLDLAFALTTKKEDLDIGRLVADDWPCDQNTPITACVWWGSYIGYGYEACQDVPSFMQLPVPPDYFLLTIWDDVPAGADLTYSHPNDIIWKYKAYDYDEVLVGYDKHPHDDPNEPVFRYSVRLPHDKWFLQDSNDGVYWFSALPVYHNHIPNYDWGWTNHKHVYNDDAVEGWPDAPGGPSGWTWYELFDQTGESEDMSFILFTDPNGYTCWDPLECAGQPKGDGTCDSSVNFLDLGQLKQAIFTVKGDPRYNCCADYNHDGAVNFLDLGILKQNIFTGGHTPATGNQNCPPGY